MENVKVIAITGATAGIGRAIAFRFAREGWALALTARTPADLDSVAADILGSHPEVEILVHPVDVRKREELKKFMAKIDERWGRLDVLVNNAGVFIPGALLEEEEGNLELMVETNLYSAYYGTRASMPLLQKSKPAHIFNMCSIASITAYPNGGSYAISKWAQLGWNNCLRSELKDENIKVTAILPGATWSRSWEGADLPPDRLMDAEHVAHMVYAAWDLPPKSTVEEIIIRPQEGDL